jgi:hypothetical protein
LGGAVGVLVALALDAPGVGVSLMAYKTFTDRSSSNIPALRSCSTNAWNTRVGAAAGAAVGTSHVAAEARAHAALAATAALRVRAAQVSARARVAPARHVGISDVKRRTLADGGSAVVFTNGFRSTWAGAAGVEPAVGVGVSGVAGLALAAGHCSVGGAVRVGSTRACGARLQSAGRERITGVTLATFADRSCS